MSGLSCNEALMQSFAREDALGDAFDRLLLKVEQLERERDVSNELGKALEEDAGQLREKLAKAVEALREIVTRWDTPAWKDVEATGSVINRARTTLAELEKK